MVTKNTENNANNALNILPESASTAVDNDEKYLSFALVLAITIMDNLVKLIGTDGFVLYTTPCRTRLLLVLFLMN